MKKEEQMENLKSLRFRFSMSLEGATKRLESILNDEKKVEKRI